MTYCACDNFYASALSSGLGCFWQGFKLAERLPRVCRVNFDFDLHLNPNANKGPSSQAVWVHLNVHFIFTLKVKY